MIILPGLDELLVNKIALVDNITLVFDEVIPTVKFSLSFRIFATTIHALLLIWGVVGNTLVTIVVQKDKSIRTPTYYYLASLTIADLIVLVSALPETIVSYHLYVRQWIFGSFGCSAWVFLNFLGINVSSTSILCFTVERYIGLCKPLLAQKLCTPKRACYVIAVSWFMGVIYASPWLFLTGLNPHLDYPEMQTCDYSLERKRYANVFIADLVLFYVFPLAVSVTLYVKIGLTVGLSHKMLLARSILRQESHTQTGRIEERLTPERNLAGRIADRLTPETESLRSRLESVSRKDSAIVEKESGTRSYEVISKSLVAGSGRTFFWPDGNGLPLNGYSFKNAFNTIYRDKLLDQVREVLPNYYSFFWQCYRFPSKLIYGQHILASARRVQLGDLLGPMLFCLAIEALTKKLTSPFNLWYWDDGTIGGDCSKVLADLCTVISEGMRIGLELNPSKCELFLQGGTSGERERIRRAFSLVCPGIIFPSRAELTLLEAPLLQEVLEPAIEEKRERIALPAFMASIHSVQALVLSIYPENDLDSVVNGGLDHWPLLTSAELPVPALRRQQRVRDLPMVTEEFGSPIDQSDMTSRARLMAVSTKTFGTWLRALPASSLGNLLDDNTLRISVGLRLGSRLCQPTCAAVEK
ncbi:hypothetical protein RvY_10910 [Ramazzottius varieornatus]|uniref:Thyrotropin-releasing hormone receptor n=1 Tax=Ramazzottius varieornatus TaxID=947166 RepID=A0A1D1VEC1_RAMVA|nr:hypothetical protein RvY_10910 [Ramazzottius varieornatus]